jgi:hypothetical protein
MSIIARRLIIIGTLAAMTGAETFEVAYHLFANNRPTAALAVFGVAALAIWG